MSFCTFCYSSPLPLPSFCICLLAISMFIWYKCGWSLYGRNWLTYLWYIHIAWLGMLHHGNPPNNLHQMGFQVWSSFSAAHRSFHKIAWLHYRHMSSYLPKDIHLDHLIIVHVFHACIDGYILFECNLCSSLWKNIEIHIRHS